MTNKVWVLEVTLDLAKNCSQDLQLYFGSPYDTDKLVAMADNDIILTVGSSIKSFQGGTHFGEGSIIGPSKPDGKMYDCTYAGYTSNNEPVWVSQKG